MPNRIEAAAAEEDFIQLEGSHPLFFYSIWLAVNPIESRAGGVLMKTASVAGDPP